MAASDIYLRPESLIKLRKIGTIGKICLLERRDIRDDQAFASTILKPGVLKQGKLFSFFSRLLRWFNNEF